MKTHNFANAHLKSYFCMDLGNTAEARDENPVSALLTTKVPGIAPNQGSGGSNGTYDLSLGHGRKLRDFLERGVSFGIRPKT